MPSEQVNIYEAKTRLSQLVDQAAAGEEIIIARNGRPVARLVPLQRQPVNRVPGAWKGKGWIAPDFDDTPQEIIDLFYEGAAFPEDD
ncbi:type II toxin-antitoxin system Phd/YefM family antitoxin [Actinophytocola sp.]|uniref:type II toxin-antitoxin system Phd/YefM family antitoxin n=1 Tax=Actinophytocola sp. TaxID=1872138 RepID=UPI002D7EC068|nr:type II toxin-antitoxin system Phd/YefM family antitoxin [Actinophytocola sp.]HET9143543.1 type II toxin-antitoxin system Phd/YefM family antitoxin [Actinophytocola sp.]